MEILSPKFNNNSIKIPPLKRPIFYILIMIIIVIGYFGFRLIGVYSSIVVNNDSWLSRLSQTFFSSKKPIFEVDPNPLPPPQPERLDVLILGIRGSTQREIEEEGGLLADSLIVVSIDKATRKTAIVSIPRDLSIDILGVDGKINQIYERGFERGQEVELAEQIISRMTGVRIDKTVVFDFNAFQGIVDTLGGIDIYLAKPFIESSQWGYEFSLPAGNSHLSGEEALYYVRSRFSTSDFDRARRQQEVIVAIKNKAVKNGYFSNPVKLTDLLSELKGDIRTDFQIWDIKDLLDLAKSFDPKAPVKSYVMTYENLLYESKSPKGEYILLPKEDNYAGIKNLFATIFSE